MRGGFSGISPVGPETLLARIREALAEPAGRDELTDGDLLAASEIAYRAANFALATDCMELLVRRAPDNAGHWSRLASFYHLQGQGTAAEQAYGQAIALDPRLENAYHGLRELRIGADDLDGALEIARRQQENCGATDELVLAIGHIRRRQGELADALAIFRAIPAASELKEPALQAEAGTACELGLFDDALAAAERLCERYPHSAASPLIRANVLCAARRFEEAVPLLQELVDRDADNPELHRLYSGVLAETGRYQESLSHARRATELSPEIADYWHQAAILANVLGYRDEALEWMARAVALDPANPALLMAQAHLLNGLGRIEQAIEVLAHAGERFPRDPQIRDFRILLLSSAPGKEGRVEAISGPFRPLPRSTARPSRSPHKGGGDFADFLEALRIQARVILALAIRELSHRTARSKFGLISAIVEPLLQIVMLGVVLSIFTQGHPPLGKSMFFFYATGVLPFYMFLHVVGHSIGLLSEATSLLQVPRIRRIDLVLAMASAELLIGSMTTTLVFGLFFLFGYGEGTENILHAIFAYLVVWIFSLGTGLIFSVLNTITTTIESLWQTLQRFLYFLSGIFFIPQFMPPWARDVLLWNPLLVGIEWFRAGMFLQYHPPWIAKTYLVAVSITTVVAGVALERAARRQARRQ